MKLKLLMSILALLMLTHCYGLNISDSTKKSDTTTLTCFKPAEVDYFLSQDAKADSYYIQLNDCRADNKNLLNGIKEKDFKNNEFQTIIDLNNQDATLDQVKIKFISGQLVKANKKNGRLKIGCISICIISIAGCVYFSIH